MYENYFDKLQPFFGQENIQLPYVDADAFVLSWNTQDIIKDLKNLGDVIDFSNLNENQELFSNEIKKIFGKFKLEPPKNFWIDEFVCLRSKMYSFKSGDKNKMKLKGLSKSQSKHIMFEEYKKSFDEEEYQKDFDICNIRSINHVMYRQKI